MIKQISSRQLMFGFTSALQLKSHCLWQTRQPLENTAVFFKGKKLSNMDVRGLRTASTLHCCYKPKEPPHCAEAQKYQCWYCQIQRGTVVKNHTADCRRWHRPATIIFIRYCKIFLFCSTLGMAAASTVFTAPK